VSDYSEYLATSKLEVYLAYPAGRRAASERFRQVRAGKDRGLRGLGSASIVLCVKAGLSGLIGLVVFDVVNGGGRHNIEIGPLIAVSFGDARSARVAC
jgi:hypothetical protein